MRVAEGGAVCLLYCAVKLVKIVDIRNPLEVEFAVRLERLLVLGDESLNIC